MFSENSIKKYLNWIWRNVKDKHYLTVKATLNEGVFRRKKINLKRRRWNKLTVIIIWHELKQRYTDWYPNGKPEFSGWLLKVHELAQCNFEELGIIGFEYLSLCKSCHSLKVNGVFSIYAYWESQKSMREVTNEWTNVRSASCVTYNFEQRYF